MNDEYKTFRDYSLATDTGIVVIDKDGAGLFVSERYRKSGAMLELLENVMGNAEQCKISMIYGSYQSMRFGGRYIFFCPRGLLHLASPIVKNGRMTACAIAGPLLMIDADEYLELDVAKKYNVTLDQLTALYKASSTIPFADPQRVRSLSELLFLCASQMHDEPGFFDEDNRSQKLQSHISDTISQIKKNADTGYYPIEKEQALLAAMSRGDAPQAKALLNEILGHVLFQSGARFEIIRSRVVELMVLLSRAAVKGGADTELIFGLNYDYLQEIDNFKDIDQLTCWLSEIMNRFTQYVFHFAAAKHVDVIYKVVDYLRRNYMNKVTLEEVAAHVFLSPSYLSRVFKESTGHSLNSYLNTIRIEESKKLLRDGSVPLVEIASLAGYEDQSYYSKVFKKIEGISPGKYRQSMLMPN